MVRVRFAPSPTGPLHIGGVRTALYNYLFARQQKGTFILRIEDTDQARFVPGAEEYIIEALNWLGITPDEGPGLGGNHGPYRQSDRKEIYRKYAEDLVALGHAYYSFDTNEELDAMREKVGDSFKYGVETRGLLKNSISLSKDETQNLIEKGEHVAIRLKIPDNKEIIVNDSIRGEVIFNSNELDDKVILKGDGMPTYHLANIVDDHLMEITHVVRGEEWLPSTAHHVLLYDFFGWQAPVFAHLPLIFKPTGQGKLSKRDGAKFGFPVFPLNWDGRDGDGAYPGFREVGFLPEALLNFLAFLGWNPGIDQEILSKEEMVHLFNIEKIVKSGARFDYEKAKWFNQQYIMMQDDDTLAKLLLPIAKEVGIAANNEKLAYAAKMMKERVYFVNDIIKNGNYLFSTPDHIDLVTFTNKFKPILKPNFVAIAELIQDAQGQGRDEYESIVKKYVADNQLKMGEVMPILRIALTGTTQGPDLFDTISILGNIEASSRIKKILE